MLYCLIGLSHCSLKRHGQQFLRFNSKLHRKLIYHLLGISVDDKPDSLLCGDATLIAIKKLIFIYL